MEICHSSLPWLLNSSETPSGNDGGSPKQMAHMRRRRRQRRRRAEWEGELWGWPYRRGKRQGDLACSSKCQRSRRVRRGGWGCRGWPPAIGTRGCTRCRAWRPAMFRRRLWVWSRERRFTEDSPNGRATALLNWKLLVIEFLPEEDAIMSTRSLSEVSEVEAIRLGLDLVPAARRNIGFLKAVADSQWLHQKPTLIEAIRRSKPKPTLSELSSWPSNGPGFYSFSVLGFCRYNELWMPLIADLTVGSTPPLILPPIDIEWVWFCHTLNPVSKTTQYLNSLFVARILYEKWSILVLLFTVFYGL